MGKLYLVPTPIGNLKDITFRAIEVLKEVDFILAEDTRTSGKLLKYYEITTPMQSHHMHNEHKTWPNSSFPISVAPKNTSKINTKKFYTSVPILDIL